MRFYAPIAKVDAEERMVWGYASTGAEDDQGEIITRDALAAALAGYMKFANIREMHQMSAVGIAEEAGIDDKGLYVGARIVDPQAWDKVKSGVYKGFSVGGKVRARDPRDRHVITALTLTEISLVDRPANPEAVFDCWKAEGAETPAEPAPLDHIHDCLRALTDGACCTAVKAMDPLKEAHDALCRAGARCAGFAAEAAADEAAKGAMADELMKAVSRTIVPRLDVLEQAVAALQAAPLPPQTIAYGGISKREDGGQPGLAAEDVVAALARMNDEERTLALIKAAHANPIRPFGSRF